MTYEEALESVNRMLEKRAFVFSAIYQISFWLRIQEALEKLVPKKPINEPGSLMGKKFDQYFCPSCYEERVELHTPHTRMMDYNVTERMHCCPLCGQKIDWSDVSD